MTGPTGLVNAAVQEIQALAEPLGLAWQMRLAVVVNGDTPSDVQIIFDGDAVDSAAAVRGQSMIGPLATGARVHVMSVPPAGQYVVGYLTSSELPQEEFQTANDTTTSTSYVTGTTHGVAFIAPPSGKVYISFRGWVGHNSITVSFGAPWTLLSDEVAEGATLGAGTVHTAADDTRAILYFNRSVSVGFKYDSGSLRHLVENLVPGAMYNVVTKFRENATPAGTAAINDRGLLVEPVR